jgi:hypothetical protein
MKGWLKNLLRWVRKKPGVVFVVLFALFGVVLLVATRAATPVASFETENGTLGGAATVVADAGASGGSAVRFGGAPGAGTTASSVSQYGITWTFNQEYPVGQFANGDWWVQGPVTITALTPAFTGTQNGWEVNPNSGSSQGLDNRLDGFQASRVPALPYVATAGKSIIKAVSKSGTCGNDGQFHYPCLTTAAVLTVLGSVPANNGANTFRPPFFGTAKPMYTTTQLRTDKLSSRAAVSGAPSLAGAARRYQRVQVDYGNTWYGRYMHASHNYTFNDNPNNDQVSEYGAELGIDAADVALRLLLNDTLSAKMPAVVNYVQAGIDMYGMHNGGVEWVSDGGHFLGRKLPAVFAATLLDDPTMKAEISNAEYATYGDDGHAYYTTNPQTVAAMQATGYAPALWGKPCGNGQYEQQQTNDTGPRDCRDPIGMIDGGEAPGDSYQHCCTTQPMKGASLATRLLPGAKAVWNYQPYHDYVDRWVGFGAWASPDNWNSLGRTPARNYTSRHGTAKDGGSYGSTFVNNMWNSYRSSAE